ncbi:hypothetical protein GOODEAATRI_028156, partial [Goodea atripinnis]
WRMFRHELEIHPEVAEKCVKATCLCHNFMRTSGDGHVPEGSWSTRRTTFKFKADGVKQCG